MAEKHILRAGDGLALNVDPALPHWRIQWPGGDWFGPVGFAVEYQGQRYCSAGAPRAEDGHRVRPAVKRVRSGGPTLLGATEGIEVRWRGLPFPVETSVYTLPHVGALVFEITARGEWSGLGTGAFERPSVAWPTFLPCAREPGGVPAGTTSYGHAYCEFAHPGVSDADCATFQRPGHRPPVVEPLMLIAPDGRTLMLAPLEGFHDQIIAVPDGAADAAAGIRCGWHGDITDVVEQDGTKAILLAGESPRAVLGEWGRLVTLYGFRLIAHSARSARYADDTVGKLSYWTDNGAVYYYRTDRDADYTETLERIVADLRARDIPIGSVQLDSWFYPHENLRKVSPDGAPVVPPSGMLTWEPRADVFPDGLGGLRERLGNLPLAFHSRHFSSKSPYFAQYDHWVDGAYAHPRDPVFYHALLDNVVHWGGVLYEQDWLVEAFLRVRGLREVPGAAADWQMQLNEAARERGLSLQWCMASPADFMETVFLDRVTSIRTSGDYRYVFDNGLNWYYFLQTNALARALNLIPFKDVFISHADTGFGEPHAEAEALLAALSAGPVAIGDAIGHANRDIIMRTCREDGVLIKPDAPIAAVDRCFRTHAFFEPAPLIGETHSAHEADVWMYVAAFNAYSGKQRLDFRIELADLGFFQPMAPLMAYNWRTGELERLEADGGWDLALEWQDWDFRVLCPLLLGDVTIIGDVTKYATMGDRRIGNVESVDDSLQFDAVGPCDTWVDVHGYAAGLPDSISAGFPQAPVKLQRRPALQADEECWTYDADTGRWIVRVHLGRSGRQRVQLDIQ